GETGRRRGSFRSGDASSGGSHPHSLPQIKPESYELPFEPLRCARSFSTQDLTLAGKRDPCRISRTSGPGSDRANSSARAKGVFSLRSRAIRISRRGDHLEWRLTASTKA